MGAARRPLDLAPGALGMIGLLNPLIPRPNAPHP
jgi:hypothetical protein